MSSSSGAPAPVFSYAQAAKGLASAASTQSTSRNESPAASDKGAKDRSINETASAPSALKSLRLRAELEDKEGGETLHSNSSTRADSIPSKPSNTEIVDHDDGTHTRRNHTGGSEESGEALSLDEIRGNDSVHELSNGRKPSSDESSAIASPENNSQIATEKKSKDGDEDWEKVSVPSIPADPQYKAAPLPSVNIWQIRKEAQAAKVKEHQKPTVPSPTSQPRKSRSASEDLKRKPSGRDTNSTEKHGKIGDNSATTHCKDNPPARSSRPVSQQGEKAVGDTLPSVMDTISWPTPENSTTDDRRKSLTFERGEKQDPKSGAPKSHGNKWVAVPFVPTAKFETQLPPAAARRGGRGGARGGRDAGGRGGNHNGPSGEKQDVTGSMGPPPLPRQSGEQDRGRRAEGQQNVRGASVPTSGNRPTTGEESNGAFLNLGNSDAQDEPASANNTFHATTAQPVAQDQTPRTEHSSRSSSQHARNLGDGRTNGEQGNQAEQAAGTFGQVRETAPKYPPTYERNKASIGGSLRGNGEFGRDRGSGKVREWSREKSESAREKVESWRDRDSSGDQSSRRGGRSERGRGSYRGGRGDHSFSQTFTSSHAYTSPLPQNGFEPPSRSTSHTESRSRQTSQPFVPIQAANAARNSSRSQSIPVGMVYPGYFSGMPAMPQQGLPAIQTDMSMYGYASHMQMQPSIMSAMPYNDPLNSYALLSMVTTQIEYYFSIDNLCKDVFLRKHMDGQGYVQLAVIANFKRIKTLVEGNMSAENLRYVCQQVKSVELLPGPDGDDRLRRRDGWRDFVLPIEERFESARNDGPLHTPESYSRSIQQAQAAGADTSFGYDQLRSPSFNAQPNDGPVQANVSTMNQAGFPEENQVVGAQSMNSMEPESNGVAARPALTEYSRTSSNAVRSPLAGSPAPLGNIVNGHHRQGSRADIEENVFPDDQIPNVNIRMRPHELSVAAPSFPALGRVNAGGSSNGRNDVNNPTADMNQARLSGLRGGSGSPQQLEQFRSLSFIHAAGGHANGDNIMYFTKDGHEKQLPPPQDDQYDQTYVSFHNDALKHRQDGYPGALEPLYDFWADFLVGRFNLGMYQEFKDTAIGDQQAGDDRGISYLVRFYGKILSGTVPISERLASDIVSLSRQERSEKRPVLQIMRAAWRNGATNMKTIKRLGEVLTAEEKAQLDKSG